MGILFGKQSGEKIQDSVYERRRERGEVPTKSYYEKVREKSLELEEQRRLVQLLSEENRRLRRELEKVQAQLSTMEFTHSMDELIDAMREEKKKPDMLFNPFAGILGKPSASASSSTDSGNAESMLSPEHMAEVQGILNGEIPDDAEIFDEDIDESDGMDDR